MAHIGKQLAGGGVPRGGLRLGADDRERCRSWGRRRLPYPNLRYATETFDRGATFAQRDTIASGNRSTRLVQIAMAADYSLAIVYWATVGFGSAVELMLVEGRPASFDPTGSPTWFESAIGPASWLVDRAPALP